MIWKVTLSGKLLQICTMWTVKIGYMILLQIFREEIKQYFRYELHHYYHKTYLNLDIIQIIYVDNLYEHNIDNLEKALYSSETKYPSLFQKLKIPFTDVKIPE